MCFVSKKKYEELKAEFALLKVGFSMLQDMLKEPGILDVHPLWQAIDKNREALAAHIAEFHTQPTQPEVGPYQELNDLGLVFPLLIPDNQYGDQLALWRAEFPDDFPDPDKDAFYLSNDNTPYTFDIFGFKVKKGATYFGFRKAPSGKYVNGGAVALLLNPEDPYMIGAIPLIYMTRTHYIDENGWALDAA